MQFCSPFHIPRAVQHWLLAGLLMILIQIVIGGVTRLTGSGLSITRWEVVKGSIPPLDAAAWDAAFQMYRQTPQYQKINRGMSMEEFKFIYFWEYFHRLWARLMFFVFIVPFFWFLWRGMLSRALLPRLLAVVALAGLEGFFGWIMVASGLIQRPWVNAYNLTLHLTMALVIFSYLFWTWMTTHQPRGGIGVPVPLRRFAWSMVFVVFLQIALGAMMSGTKAGLFYPTWPDLKGSYLPDVLLHADNWKAVHFIDYDTHPFMTALVQFLHRNTAYLLTVLLIMLGVRLLGWLRNHSDTSVPTRLRFATYATWILLSLQVLLGILTLLSCQGSIPVLLGVLHQACAVLLLTAVLYLTYQCTSAAPSSTSFS